MKKLLQELKVDETYTKPLKKEKLFTHIDDNIPHKSNYNFMMDILILPRTKEGYNMLLVCVDMWSRAFDIEPIKNKDAKTVLNAFKTMIKRPYIELPEYSVVVDNDGAFKGEFAKYLHNENIFKKTAEPYRHKQMGLVEAYNKQIGRVLNLYMNKIEEQTGEQYNEWTDIIPFVRKEYNKERKRKDGNPRTDIYEPTNLLKKPKFNEGDIVYVKSEIPLNALGKKQADLTRFRTGDYRFVKVPKKIIKVIPFSGDIPYRFIVEGKPHVSYTPDELIKAEKQENETKYVVEKIIGKKRINNKIHYLIKWKNYKTKDATYEPEKQLIEDGFKEMIDEFNTNN
jgi:hypothetical protein